MGVGGWNGTKVFSFYISVFTRVRRTAERAKTHRNTLESCQRVLKTNMYLKELYHFQQNATWVGVCSELWAC